MLRSGVLLHIMDGLLRHAQNFALRSRRQWPVCAEDAEAAPPIRVRLRASTMRRSRTGSVVSPESCERSAQIDCRASASPSRT